MPPGEGVVREAGPAVRELRRALALREVRELRVEAARRDAAVPVRAG